ncbi:MAG TPA: sulfotransferase [Burkholderiaceae bacterium]|nr:sulfotransferase [Burkholderiaceae bacterium]
MSSLPQFTTRTAPEGRLAELGIKVRKTLQHQARQATVAARGRLWDAMRWPAVRPIFIVGCSRSGTLMLYKTLAESRELGALKRDLYAFWWRLHPPARKQWATNALGAEDATPYDRDAITRHFYAHTGRLRLVGKNNAHGLCIPYLHALFPDAHFVFIKRNPGDTLNSMMDGWARPERFATWSIDLPAEVAVDGERYTRWCFFLVEGWRAYLRSPLEEVCAFQYAAIHRAILDARAGVPSSQWTEVFYEDFIRDPLTGFRRLFASCDLRFDPALQRHAATALTRPFEPQSEIRAGKWREQAHVTRIERVLPALQGLARELGYTH